MAGGAPPERGEMLEAPAGAFSGCAAAAAAPAGGAGGGGGEAGIADGEAAGKGGAPCGGAIDWPGAAVEPGGSAGSVALRERPTPLDKTARLARGGA